MHMGLMFPSKYLAAADFKGKDFTLKIKRVTIQELAAPDGGVKTKGLIAFEGAKKLWVLNRTVAECMKAMWGPETDNWVGKEITLYGKLVDAFGEETLAIRVRGSPTISKPIKKSVQRGQKTIKIDLIPTGKAAAGSASQLAEPTPEDEAGAAGDLGDPGQPTPEERAEYEAERARGGR